ncbi:MAG: MFS transporter [Armatimonadetes bacterium]|nr:MFS transporter [Armatimonadota bacterium]
MERRSSVADREKLWTRDFLLICLSNLATFMGFQMLMPTLPVYVDFLGGKESEIGLVIGFFTISAVIIRPVAGKGVDTYGRRGIYLLGLLVFTLSCLLYNWTYTIPLLLLVRFLHGFGWGASSTAAGTVAADVIPKQRLGEGMGYYGLAATIAMAVAPATGLYLINEFSFPVLFYASTGLAALAFLLGSLIHYRKMPAARAETKGALFEKSAFRPSLVIFFVAMSYGSVVSFIALYAAEKGIANIGVFFTVYAVTLAFTRPFSGILLDRKGYDVVVYPGLLAIAAALLLLSRAEYLGMFLLAGVFYGIGFGSVQPGMQALTVRNVAFHRRGAANGTFFSAFDLGIAVGALLWGAASQAVGYSQMYLWTALPVLVALILYRVSGRAGRESPAT